jgi:hypothetical protein
MKTVSIKKLHETTGKWVREARDEMLVITDRGQRVAVMKAYSEAEIAGRPFPKRDVRRLPAVDVDSKELISDDRDVR